MPQTVSNKIEYFYKDGQLYKVTRVDTNVAPVYDSSLTYSVGDLVLQGEALYQCVEAVAEPEAFDSAK